MIELPESMLGSQTLEKKKAAKSILKKAHFTGEEVPIEKIFDKAYNQGLIEEVMAESSKTLRPVNELLAKNFTKTWHEVEKNEEDALRFLKVFFFFFFFWKGNLYLGRVLREFVSGVQGIHRTQDGDRDHRKTEEKL